MPLQTSGAITLADIQTEFGGENPISLSEYYAGGAYVPAGTSGTNGAVPSSGAISLSNFYGTTAVVISITNQTVLDIDDPRADAYYFLTSGGLVSESRNAGGTSPSTLETWCTPTSQAANYDVLVTVTSGTLSGSATGTWLSLSTTRSWFVECFVSGQSNQCIFTVEIRRTGTTTVLDSATITLEATIP